MFKTPLFRKGLAVGAAISLGTTMLATAPAAQAVDLWQISPVAGTSFNGHIDSPVVFKLQARYNNSIVVASGNTNKKLSFLVEDLTEGIDLTSLAATPSITNTPALATNKTFYVNTDNGSLGAYSQFWLQAKSSVTATFSVKVTPFIDFDGDGWTSGFDVTGPTQEVKFLASGDITATTKLETPSVGDAIMQSSATIATDINTNYLGATPANFVYKKDGSALGAATAVAISSGVAKQDYTYTVGAGSYTSQLQILGTDVGTAASATAKAVTADSVSRSAVVSDNTSAIGKYATNVSNVRAATATAKNEFVVTVSDEDGAALPAGVLVTTVVSRAATVDSGAKVNGVVVGGSGAGSVTIYERTDANGQVKLTLENATGTAGQTLSFAVSSEGVSATAFSATYTARVWTVHNTGDTTGVGYGRTIADGGSASYNLLVADQWKVVPTGTLRFQVTPWVNGAPSALLVSNVSVADGKATVTVSDPAGNVAATNLTGFIAQLQSQTGTVWSDVAGVLYGGNGAMSIAAATNALTSITAAPTSLNVDSKTIAAYNGFTSTAVTPAYTSATTLTITGAQAGTPVTVSASGVLFGVDNGSGIATHSLNSITFIAGAGPTTVVAIANIAGKKTITATAGTATKTVDVTWNGITATKVAISGGAATSLPGRVHRITVSATDKFGNKAAATPITLSLTGLGTLDGGLGSVSLNTGATSTALLAFAGNDVGSATLTATVTGSDPAISATATVLVQNPTFVVRGKVNKVNVTVKGAQGQSVKIYVSGKLRGEGVAAWTSAKWTVKAKTGKRKVSVYVSGVRLFSKYVKVS